jgi:hypothetical protein
MRTVHANAWNIRCSTGEIVLLFGLERERNQAKRELVVELSNRIILTPGAARQLAADLRAAVQAHEAEHGPVEPLAPGHAPPRRVSRAEILPAPSAPGIAARAERLFQAVRALDAPCNLEHSVKISRARLTENRFLMSLAKGAISQAPEDRVLDLSARLGIPATLASLFASRLPAANYIHVGFEEHARGALYKMYLEFWTDWEHEITSWPVRREPFVVYLGFKWDPADAAWHAVSTYTCHPWMSVDEMRTHIGGCFRSGETRDAEDAALGILDRASRRIGPGQLLYLEVTEADNPRRSFDINVYKADLRVHDLGELLERMCRHFMVSPEAFQAFYARAKDKRLGHVSGGIDRGGEDFLTIYYGARG